MESHSNDMSSQPIDPVAALRVASDAQTRMAARIRSAWWVHVLRGVLVGATVFGLGGRPDGVAWLLPVGVVGLAVLARWRTRALGVSRANPERWQFLTLGAPWSVVALVVAAAAMAFVVIDHAAPLWQIGTAAVVAAVVTVALGPVADHAARRRMSGDFGAAGDLAGGSAR